MSDYDPLRHLLEHHPGSAAMMDFGTVEAILGRTLPDSARKHREWWANDESSKSRHCHAWLDAGWRVHTVLLDDHLVVFKHT
jgi:hypothetical protein